MSEIGSAYLRVMPDTSGLNARMAAYFRSSDWGKLGKTAGAALGVGIAAGGAAKALYEVGEAFDDVSDKIRVGTGATGKNLRRLESDFQSVIKSVPADFDSAADAVTGLNVRLGLTGKPLRNLAKQFTELSRITETDVEGNIQSVTRAFGDWEVKTGQQAEQLDKFFRASQSSGAAVSELADQVVQFGAPLRQVGFDLDEATAMFASFEQAGVNTQTMMPGLRLALSSFLEEGLEPGKALRDTFEGIEDGTIKTTEALEIFGKRAGADMVEAIRQGRFDLDKLTRSLESNDETIRKAGRDTMDFSEHWQVFKNNVLVGLEPIATRVFEGVGNAMEDLTKAFRKEGIGGVFDLVMDEFDDAAPRILDAGKDLAARVVKGFLDSGVWGQLAIGALLYKMLGGISALNAVSEAGDSLGQRFGAGLKAGLMKVGITAILLGVLNAVNEITRDKGAEMAEQFSASFGEALRETIERRSIPALRALERHTDRLANSYRDLADEGWADMDKLADAAESSARRSAQALERLTAKTEDAKQGIHELRVGYFADLDAILDKTRDNMDKIANAMGANSERGRDALARNFQSAVAAIRRAMDDGRISSDKGLTEINELIRKRLAVYGIEGSDAEKIIKARREGPGQYQGGLARGGFIDVGKPVGDSVPALLERDEGVLNRNATAALGGKPFIDWANSKWSRFQTGGIVGLGKQLQKQGYAVGEHPAFGGVSAVHSPNSYHYRGMALDINADTFPGGEMAALDRLYARLKNMPGVVELLWRVADHFDHLHVAMSGAGGPLGALGGGLKLELPRFMAKYPVFAPGAAGLNNVSAALETLIGRRAGAIEGSEAGISTGGAWESVLKEIAGRRGWSIGDWMELVMRESGGNPAAVNPSSGAFGLGQFLGATKAAYAKYGATSSDGALQIKAMAKYIADRYGSPSAALAFHDANNWYSRGGVVDAGWFGNGGSVTADRPTILGIGERGRETARVTRGDAEPKVEVYITARGSVEIEDVRAIAADEVQVQVTHDRQLERMR